MRAKAMDAIEKAVSLGLTDLSPVERHPWLDNVRKDPAFPARMEKWKKGNK